MLFRGSKFASVFLVDRFPPAAPHLLIHSARIGGTSGGRIDSINRNSRSIANLREFGPVVASESIRCRAAASGLRIALRRPKNRGDIAIMHTHELTLTLAFGLGALHALEPGHGKTAMLIYLAGERRSFLHPLVMGLSSAFSHSLSLIGIAAMVHLTHHLIAGDHHHTNEGVTEAMRWISAGLVLAVGIWMICVARNSKPESCNCGSHDHACDKSSQKKIELSLSAKTSYSMSALLGAAFGLMPCPSALAAYFSGLSSGSPITAYIVIGLFAAGIAFSLTTVGMVVQAFGSRFSQAGSRLSHFPWASFRGVLITLVGLVYLGFAALK